METQTRATAPMSLTCERCNKTDRWLGPVGWITFPDGWSLVSPEWRAPNGPGPSLWVCAGCLTPEDDAGTSWVLPVGSDGDAPEITMLAPGHDGDAHHDCDREYRTDCARCNGVSPGDVGTW